MGIAEIRELNDSTIGDYIKNHAPSYTFEQFPKRDSNMVIACMDPRSNPNELWGISESNPKGGILRNAGGRVTEDVLRSVRTLSAISGYGDSSVSGVAVIHHKDCGMTHFRNERIGQLLVEHAGLEGEVAEQAKKLDYGEVTDVEASVWEDMKKLKADPYLRKDLEVIGYVWDSINNTMKEIGTL